METEHETRVLPSSLTLPLLIHGRPGDGGSMATVVLAAELIRSGESVVWMCAKPEAIRRLSQELQLEPHPIRSKQVDVTSRPALTDSQLVTMHGEAGFLCQSLRALGDWSERIVILKNIETTLNPDLWSVLKSHRRLVCSGDMAGVTVPLHEIGWSSQLAFSPYPASWNVQRSTLPLYAGELQRAGHVSTTVIVSGVPEKMAPR